MIHSSANSSDNVGKVALSFVGENFDGKDGGTCGRPEFTRNLLELGGFWWCNIGLHSSRGTSGVSTMTISISAGIRAEGGKEGGTSSEARVFGKDSSINTWSRVRTESVEDAMPRTVEVGASTSSTLL